MGFIGLNHKVWLIDIIDLYCYIGNSNTFTRIRLFQIKNSKLKVDIPIRYEVMLFNCYVGIYLYHYKAGSD